MTGGIPVRCTMVSVLALRGSPRAPEVLAVCRAGPYLEGAWTYVAGHVEAGEAGWQAARRELAEETGLVALAWHATGFCEQFYSMHTGCIEIVPAFVARVADDALVTLDGEHSEYRWVSIEEAAALFPFGSQRDLLAHVRREFVERDPGRWLRIAPT